jgi:hypothetical protein
MKPDEYKVLQMAIQDGIAIGYRRAFKHNENPDEDAVIDRIQQEVMTQICEWFKFEDIQE